MRYLFGFLCVCALGVTPLVGCSETTGDGGSGGSAGTGGSGGGGTGGMPECQNPEDCDDGQECTADVCADGMCEYTPLADGTACDESNECTTGMCASGECDTTPVLDGTVCGNGVGTCQTGICSNVACTEQGIRDAIAAGGGPYTFDCNGPQTVVTAAEILIDNDVILDGKGNLTMDGNSDALPEEDQYPVFVVLADVTAELRGFVVTGGNAIGEFGEGGGGVLNMGTLTMADSAVSGNSAESIGGGIRNTGTLTMTTGAVSENSGTGILNQGTMMLTNITVSRNSGSGIHNEGTMTLTNSRVSENTCGDYCNAAGILNTDFEEPLTVPVLTLTNSTVSGNTCGDYCFGAGISNVGHREPVGVAMLTLTNSTVSENTCGDYCLADGIANDGTLTLTNSTVSNNDEDGRFAWPSCDVLNNGTLTLTNSTVSNHTRSVDDPEDAPICNSTSLFRGANGDDNPMLTLINSTVSGDIAEAGGAVWSEPGATTTLINSVVDGDCIGGGVITSNGYNIESPGDTCGFDQTGDQPGVTAEELNLGPLQDNGGPTETHALGLLPTLSVAIDQIPEAECLDADGSPLTTDQRGLARPVPIPGPEAKCDVGAFEEQGP